MDNDFEAIERQFCLPSVLSSTMISIDQLLHFISVNEIGRKRSKSRREKHLFSAVYLSERMICMAFFLSKMSVADEGRDGLLQFTHL